MEIKAYEVPEGFTLKWSQEYKEAPIVVYAVNDETRELGVLAEVGINIHFPASADVKTLLESVFGKLTDGSFEPITNYISYRDAPIHYIIHCSFCTVNVLYSEPGARQQDVAFCARHSVREVVAFADVQARSDKPRRALELLDALVVQKPCGIAYAARARQRARMGDHVGAAIDTRKALAEGHIADRYLQEFIANYSRDISSAAK